MKDRGEPQLSPESRTREFFSQPVESLARSLYGKTIILAGTNRMAIITDVEPWKKGEVTDEEKARGVKQVGPRYELLNHLEAGDLYVYHYAFRRMRQSLVNAKDDGEVGACVRIRKAQYFNPTTRMVSDKDPETGAHQTEGGLAAYFQFEDNEVVRLKFLNDSETLYAMQEGHIFRPDQLQPIEPLNLSEVMANIERELQKGR